MPDTRAYVSGTKCLVRFRCGCESAYEEFLKHCPDHGESWSKAERLLDGVPTVQSLLDRIAKLVRENERISKAESERDTLKGHWETVCEQIAQMCERLGMNRTEDVCDSWGLRDALIRLERENERLRNELRDCERALESALKFVRDGATNIDQATGNVVQVFPPTV